MIERWLVTRSAFVPLVFPPWIGWGVRSGAHVDHELFRQHFPDVRHQVRDGVEIHGTGATAYEWPKWKKVGAVKRCGWCGGECKGRRTSWCGDRCHDAFYRVWNWAALAQYVTERDQVCQRCRSANPGWKRVRDHGVNVWEDEDVGAPSYHARVCNLMPWWEVDHIHPVVEGGTDDPANLQLLCHACHVIVGNERRAAKKAALVMI